jgi:asparagine synthase (glutamine-hydrolysing)
LARLEESVRLRLISDVPLGAFLSGGVDSGAVVAMMARLGSAPVKTFSIGFEEQEYDELPYAREVARRYGTDHHEFVVRPNAVEIFDKLVWHYNEPYADESAIPTFYLSELTRRHVTVALNGDGGDENFAGYSRYLTGTRGPVFPPLRHAAAAVERLLPSPGRSGGLIWKAKRRLQRLASTRAQRYAWRMMQFDPFVKALLCTPDFLTNAGGDPSVALLSAAYEASGAPDETDAMMATDVAHYLPDCLLVKVDVATMAHGLEARSPLLDHKFMEFAASLPSHMKLRDGSKKHIFRQAVGGLLPDAVVNRRKMGFGVPLDHWFRGELKEMAWDLLLASRHAQRGYFRPAVVHRLLDEHANKVANWQDQIYNLLMLELWHRTFIDARPSIDRASTAASPAARAI